MLYELFCFLVRKTWNIEPRIKMVYCIWTNLLLWYLLSGVYRKINTWKMVREMNVCFEHENKIVNFYWVNIYYTFLENLIVMKNKNNLKFLLERKSEQLTVNLVWQILVHIQWKWDCLMIGWKKTIYEVTKTRK